MTLIIITGEIDLSVASILGLSSVARRRPAPRTAADRRCRPCSPWSSALACGALNGFLVAVRRPAVARGHDRHPRPLPRPGRRAARHQGGHRLPAGLDRPRQPADRDHRRPADRDRRSSSSRSRSRCCCTSPVRPRRLRHRPEQRGGAVQRRRRARAPSSSSSCSRGVVSAFAGVYFTLRFGSARGDNAHRPGAAGDRGGAARRRLDLRRPRPACSASSPGCC